MPEKGVENKDKMSVDTLRRKMRLSPLENVRGNYSE